ncbi:hypothetical protein [Leadbetterella sp. DM7]|uniref:hypothetical protein n=1 Tax=Leadbetterella sp. DM7 TaxID=3235085 RepID=UPI00349E9CE3
MINIKFQTSALQPAPYAYALQLDLKEDKGKTLAYDLEIEFLDRDSLTEEEILEEGFTLSDDLRLKGSLPQTWLEELKTLISRTEQTEKDELEENEDLWLLDTGKEPFYPKNPRQWADFTEQIRQAILEDSGLEKPLEITLAEVSPAGKKTTVIRGSFARQTLIVEKDGTRKSLRWNQLNALLRDLYSGDLNYDLAATRLKNAEGIYLNFGDEYWFELGKSYINKPQKVRAWL